MNAPSSTADLESIQTFHGKYPRQLWWLFFSEMWERFSFYGMRGVLTFFMVHQLMMAEDVANLQYGATQAFVYAFTFVGGLFADKVLGFRKSLFWGGALMIVGSLVLAIDPKAFFFLGIAFNIVGTGFFKPNISTMVGMLYKEGDPRRDAGFSLFYSGINVGALLGGYLCIAVGKAYSWNIAFGLTAIVMTISVLTFARSQRLLGPIGLPPGHGQPGKAPKPWQDWATYAGSLALIPVIMIMVSKTSLTDYFMYTIGPLTLIYLAYEMTRFSPDERKKLIAALVFILFSIIFWAFFEQSGGSLSLFAANNLDQTVLGIPLDPNGVNNSANSLFVIAFSPLVGLAWVALANKNLEPNTVVKFGLGFLFLAGSFYLFYATRFFANAQGITSLDLFTVAYLVITFGELCLSPIGLSIMTKLSPRPLQGVMMGMWFLASAYGQYVAGLLGAGMTSPAENATAMDKLLSYTEGYRQLAVYALISGVVLLAISPLVRKLMGEVK
ncbi:peptide MFS transporter [Hyalangium versicolor]|uniref:peptide MFS transporter n=1 Tax=Hyalangium versicolor TaxID=2861190 RepID=UPI001CCD4170|nr:peptide MFS transporter [Hyalangium versicolor]